MDYECRISRIRGSKVVLDIRKGVVAALEVAVCIRRFVSSSVGRACRCDLPHRLLPHWFGRGLLRGHAVGAGLDEVVFAVTILVPSPSVAAVPRGSVGAAAGVPALGKRSTVRVQRALDCRAASVHCTQTLWRQTRRVAEFAGSSCGCSAGAICRAHLRLTFQQLAQSSCGCSAGAISP